jgi:membrane protease YdiL (CAAX protease family)
MKSIVFLALAFAISWTIVIGSAALKLNENPAMLTPVLAASMFGPAIAALICAFAFEKGRRVEALGLRFRPNWWWLLAYLIPIAVAAASVALTLLLSDRTYVDLGAATRQIAEAQGQDLSQAPPFLLSTTFMLLIALTMGPIVNGIMCTFSEELGWRGYLHDLWRPTGFWRASLGAGFIWGLWHAPAIALYGLNYPGMPVIGVALFTGYCMLMSPLFTLVRDRGGSVWAAGIMHGTLNAVGGLTMITLSKPEFPWNGIVGIGGFIALAVGVAVVFALQRSGPRAETAPAHA